MPLRDRHCLDCKFAEDDILEKQFDYHEVVQCPKCGNFSYMAKAARTYFDDRGLWGFNRALDRNREKAAAGLGNASYKA